jgi:hypothetical protein
MAVEVVFRFRKGDRGIGFHGISGEEFLTKYYNHWGSEWNNDLGSRYGAVVL